MTNKLSSLRWTATWIMIEDFVQNRVVQSYKQLRQINPNNPSDIAYLQWLIAWYEDIFMTVNRPSNPQDMNEAKLVSKNISGYFTNLFKSILWIK